MLIGPIYEEYIIEKKGFFKKQEVEKKIYWFKFTHEGPIGGLLDLERLTELVNRPLQFDTLEKAIQYKEKIIMKIYANSFFKNSDIFKNSNFKEKTDGPPYIVEKGELEKDVNYDINHLHEKHTIQKRVTKEGVYRTIPWD